MDGPKQCPGAAMDRLGRLIGANESNQSIC